MLKTFEEYMENLENLSFHELRSLNRYYLHPKDLRCCAKCKKIFKGIQDNFYTKRGIKGTKKVSWNSRCCNCYSEAHRDMILEFRKNPGVFIKTKLVNYRHSASQKNVDFDLDAEYLVNLFTKQEGKCFYTGEEISFENVIGSRKYPHRLTPSLDRLDPEKGYTKGNVVWASYYMNRMKNDLSLEEFLKTCRLINERFSIL